jgi:hypothetical protein
MFNKTMVFHQPHTSRTDSLVTITEKKAPTDDSMRLLNEFKEKALSEILNAFEIKNNFLSGEIFFLASIDCNTNYIIRIKINNEVFEERGTIDRYDSLLKNDHELFELFFNGVSRIISKIIIEKSVDKIHNNILRR